MIEEELSRIANDPHATPLEREAAELLLMGTKPDAHLASVLAGWCQRNAFVQNRYGK